MHRAARCPTLELMSSFATRRDLENTLRAIRARVRDPREGVFGPGSVSWQINREIVVMLGGGRAALLQLAHPYVAYAVDHHSETPTDPIGRFRRTFENVFAMVFGDLETAERSARRVHAIHQRIKGPIEEDVGPFPKGHRYHALDPAALFWVHATLVDTALLVYERAVGRLSEADRERYYDESRTFASLFGVPERIMPESWARFSEYFADMLASSTITASRPCRDLARFLLQPPRRIHAPTTRWYRALTSEMLPERLRRELNLPTGRGELTLARASWPLLRAVVRSLPPRLRFFPDYVEAMQRLEAASGRPANDRAARWLEGAVLFALQPSPDVLARERARRAS